ncbi:MAG: hypothetical protein ACRC8S_15745 [Fimbriiglobus sp.]
MSQDGLTPTRRQALREKGETLYGKYCGTGGRGICAESFCVYHISRGEGVVAEDLIQYLEAVVEKLSVDDPQDRLESTRGLIHRIQHHLAQSPDCLPTAGPQLRDYVSE